MTDPKTYKFNTKTLHSGHQPDKNFGSRAVPIYQTTSYLFQDADHAAAVSYTHLTLPTSDLV